MSAKENKRLVLRYYEDVVYCAKVDDLPKFISPEYVEVVCVYAPFRRGRQWRSSPGNGSGLQGPILLR